MPDGLKAYAVFGGGGVRGAAFIGALQAARSLSIEFVGYAGVSAGSVIAVLAAAGYTGSELEDLLTTHVNLGRFLDDSGDDLRTVAKAFTAIQRAETGTGKLAAVLRFYFSRRKLFHRLLDDFGLYRGNEATKLLRELIVAKNPSLAGVESISFGNCSGPPGER